MGISFNEKNGIFHLRAGGSGYIIRLTEEKDLLHLYWGKDVSDGNITHILRPSLRAFSPNSHPGNLEMSYDTLPLEYPFYGSGDFRQPAFEVRLSNGSSVVEPKYVSHEIHKGKPALPGLPSTYVEDDGEADTLEIHLADGVAGVNIILYYTAFENFSAIARSARFACREGAVVLDRAMSCAVDFSHANFTLLQLSGSWARERHVHSRALAPGAQSIESRRGSSSHIQNPFMALLAPGAGEEHGEVYGFSLVYSGSFYAGVEVDQFFTARAMIGINPFGFQWRLGPGETFQTPEAVLVFSDRGLGGMSHTYHELFRTRLCRGTHRDRPRPVLINNWEATYFDFNEKKLLSIAERGRDIGAELFVLDDGWFGARNSDTCSLGDWKVNTDKLPGGLAGLAEKIKALGMVFGLWVEPEMVSADSDLYRAHPDWCLHVPGRRRTEARNQLVLDLSRDEVCEWLIAELSRVFSSADIGYVKWDMNRNMTEIYSEALSPERQGEVAHRYMLGLYRVMDALNRAFPDILFESCSGGGGRFDPGMLYYMPQTWTSDDTDAVERLKIQYGTGIVYPPVTIGAHVSACPNHQVQRGTPLLTRLHCAMGGNLGFELDLSALSDDDIKTIKDNVAVYKEIRELAQFGRYYRIWSPFEGNYAAWQFVSPEKDRAALFYCRVLAEPHGAQKIIRLRGLDPGKRYRLLNHDAFYGFLGYDEFYQGDALMNAGLRLTPMIGDFQSNLLRFAAE
ncbi:MAG TPA: alpha-galactosidase [Spirochaetes bacterium]|nr:alpha-galactosidase [Spirochaetota bacterium]